MPAFSGIVLHMKTKKTMEVRQCLTDDPDLDTAGLDIKTLKLLGQLAYQLDDMGVARSVQVQCKAHQKYNMWNI